jgi:hypothetical protein
LELLILISEWDYDFILRSKKFEIIIKRTLENFNVVYFVYEKPMLALRYIKAIKAIHGKTNLITKETLQRICTDAFERINNSSNFLSKRRKTDFDEFENDCSKCMTCPDMDCDRRNMSCSLTNVMLINEISEFLPQKIIDNANISNKYFGFDIRKIDPKHFEHIYYENPQFALEYLKLLTNFDVKISEKFVHIVERGLIESIHRRLRKNKIFIEILKILNNVNYKHYHLNDLRNEMLAFIQHNKEIVRTDSEIALECINFLSINGEAGIAFDIFPEFKHLPKGEEDLSTLKSFVNIFKKNEKFN